MFKNFIKISWRRIKTDLTFSLINVIGLSIGLTTTLLLFLFVVHEKSFDNFYPNQERIYRVLLNYSYQGNNEVWASNPPALKPAVKNNIPEVQKATRLWGHNFGKTASIEINNEQFIEPKLYYADPEFFDIFQLDFVFGDPRNQLNPPNTIVLSRSTAEKYFGKANPVGKTIRIDDKIDMEITGVFNDFPLNSSLDANMIASFSSVPFYDNPSWSNASFETYFLLNKNADVKAVISKMQELIDDNVSKEDQWYTFGLQPLKEMHLYSNDIKSAYTSNIGSIDEVQNFSLLAVLILIIACINYMNLATARSQKSTKEVAINKTLGASKKTLILRFFTETAFVTLIAILFAVILTFLTLPLFEELIGTPLSLKLAWSLRFFLAILVIWLATTLIAGSFPALHLSRFSPMEVIRSGKSGRNFSAILRKLLVIVQFSASVILIIGAMVVYNQLEYIQSKNLGYDHYNTLAISIAGVNSSSDRETLRNKFESLTSVSAVTMVQGFPGIPVSGRSLFKNQNNDEAISLQTNRVQGGIVDVLQLNLIAGSDLPKTKSPQDSVVDVILNRKAVDFLGISPKEAIGKKIMANLGPNSYVVGVVEDFNFSSLHSPIGGYAFNNGSEPLQYMLVRFKTTDLQELLKQFEENFKEIAPASAFDFIFLDKNVEQMYSRERRSAKAALTFAGLAVLVACLGLFGLSAFMAEQRKKEIGVRKVLGASIVNIISLLTKDLILLVFIALFLAFPFAYWLANKWLQDFAYRTSLSWSIFLIAGTAAISIGLITIGLQAFRAAVSNPVISLRSE